jgi:hypothetical protein
MVAHVQVVQQAHPLQVDLKALLLPEALLVILDPLVQQSLIKLQVLLVGLLVDLLPEGLSAIHDRLVQQSLTEPQQQALMVGLLVGL